MSERRGGVRIEVCVLFMAAMFIAGMYTISGCTKGGFFGVYDGMYEGVSNAIDLVAEAEAEEEKTADRDTFKSKRRSYSDDSDYEKDSDIDDDTPIKDKDKKKNKTSLAKFFKMIKDFFTGKKKSGFDNMGTQFRTTQFVSTVNPSEARIQDFFGGVKFSSKCCPSRYSTDTGCACLDNTKFDVIKHRGGNNMPFSQW